MTGHTWLFMLSIVQIDLFQDTVPMRLTSFEPARFIDLERFPLHDLEGHGGRAFVVRCREELDDTGACNLQGFIKDGVFDEVVREAQALCRFGYRKDTKRNAYFTKDDLSLPSDHPLRAFFSLKMSQVANDVIPNTAAIQQLYEWDPL